MDESDDDMPGLVPASSSSDSSSDEDVADANSDTHLPERVSDSSVAVPKSDDDLPELVSDSSDDSSDDCSSSDDLVASTREEESNNGPTNASNGGDSSDNSLPPLVSDNSSSDSDSDVQEDAAMAVNENKKENQAEKKESAKRVIKMTTVAAISSQHKRQRTEATSKSSREAARRKWLSMTSSTDLSIVEKLLRESILAATSTNNEEELRLSRDALCLLLCQQSRDKEAVEIMKQLGHVARLSKEVLHYHQSTSLQTIFASGSAAKLDPMVTPLRVFDNSLSKSTLKTLQSTFCAADANYWSSHGYSVYPPSPYFSFVVPLDGSFEKYGALGDLLRTIISKTEEHFGGAEFAKFAEFWAHRRPHSSGHQLHFDSDDEGRGGIIRNPLVSSVLYLSEEGCGGPTLVTDQHIDGTNLAQNGFLAFPKENRLVIFDGAVLHGVIPGRGYVSSERTRTTLMVALWDDIQVRKGNGPGAARPLPVNHEGSKIPEWCKLLTSPVATNSSSSSSSKQGINDGDSAGSILIPISGETILVNPILVSQVWTDLSDNEIGHSKPSYDVCFQGF
jgi:hypothetical protein